MLFAVIPKLVPLAFWKLAAAHGLGLDVRFSRSRSGCTVQCHRIHAVVVLFIATSAQTLGDAPVSLPSLVTPRLVARFAQKVGGSTLLEDQHSTLRRPP